MAALSKYAASALAFGEVEFIKPRPRGYVSKERAYLRTMDHFGKMERKLVAIRSKTLDGLFAKARALEADRDVSEDLRESTLKDLFGCRLFRAAARGGLSRKRRRMTGTAKGKNLTSVCLILGPIDASLTAHSAFFRLLSEGA